VVAPFLHRADLMLALICGKGEFPKIIAQNCTMMPLIASLAQFPPDELIPDICFRLETLGSFLELLKQRRITQVCFVGAIKRPSIDPTLIDSATRPLVARITAALAQGDDGALKVVIEIFEHAGFQVVGFGQVMPELLPPLGILSRRAPNRQDQDDAARAAAVIVGMSPLDIGQACAVAGSHVLAVEAYGGTEWMLQSLIARRQAWPTGGILFKAPKTGQERRIDLPAIGPATCRQVKKAGLDGIVIAHGGVVVLDLAAVIGEANRMELFFWVRENLL
jgi:DUF1009 family protein